MIWRKARGNRRNVVGLIKRTATNGITFTYLEKGVKEAKKEGFKEYPGFPLNFSKKYKENNLDIFSLRLIPFERKDNKNLLSFWEAKGISDKFELLALTQGLLPTDNFEFLGNFNPKKNFRFVTDIAGLSHLKLPNGTINEGDSLAYSLEKNKYAYDNEYAIKISKGNLHIGYIKLIHDKIFQKARGKIKLTVKKIEQNSVMKNIFITVDCHF